MDTKLIKEYRELKLERKDIANRIAKLEKELDELGQQPVRDKVRGGEGGKEGYTVEGKGRDYSNKKTALQTSRMRLGRIEQELDERLKEVEEFIERVPSGFQRIALRLHYQDGLSWNKTAEKLGQGYTGDAVRISTTRYLKKIERKK